MPTLLTFRLIIKTKTVAKHYLAKQKTIGNQTKQSKKHEKVLKISIIIEYNLDSNYNIIIYYTLNLLCTYIPHIIYYITM